MHSQQFIADVRGAKGLVEGRKAERTGNLSGRSQQWHDVCAMVEEADGGLVS